MPGAFRPFHSRRCEELRATPAISTASEHFRIVERMHDPLRHGERVGRWRSSNAQGAVRRQFRPSPEA